MLTKVPIPISRYTPLPAEQRVDDMAGHAHRQVIGYLGLALPILLVQAVRVRPNAPVDGWAGNSISAYYWTGAVSLFAGLLAVLSIYLITYDGYRNDSQKYDRLTAIVAGIAAAVVALFPTTPPAGMVSSLTWWHGWINTVHFVAATVLFSMFALFSLWLFRKTAPGEQPAPDKKRRNAVYLLCGIGIVASMLWAFLARQMDQSIFWPESLALGFFAWSWLLKGRAVHSIKATARAATAKMNR